MSNIKPYTKNGKTFYHVKGYLGVDPLTGKQLNFDRRNFKTRRDADLAYSRAKLKFENGDFKQKTNAYTFEEVYEHWFEVYKDTVRESTYVKTEQLFNNHILPKIGNYIIKNIKPFHLQDAVNDWHKRLSKYKVIYRYMKRVFKYAFIQEYIRKNPTDKVVIPTKEVEYDTYTREKDFYTKPELEYLLDKLKHHESHKWYTVFRLLAFSGIRRGEALALTWGDIDLKEHTLDISKTLAQGENNTLVVQKPKTKSSIRNIGLDALTIQALKKWRTIQAEFFIGRGFNVMNQHQLVFSTENKNEHLNLGAFRAALVTICKRHDLEFINIHGFRHTHASLLFEAGLQMDEVKDRLGHAKITTTMDVYTHVTPQRKDIAAEKFANYLNF